MTAPSCRPRPRPAAAGAGPHDGHAGRGPARPGYAGRLGRRSSTPTTSGWACAVGAGSADLFFLLGVADAEAVRWLEQQFAGTGTGADGHLRQGAHRRGGGSGRRARHRGGGRRPAGALGVALPTRQPRLRAPRRPRRPTDSGTDLFGLAQSIADRTRGMVSIEDEQSHVLAYSASSDEADELRRLTILGRAGPPEHLEWIGQWGIFDALRAGGDVVRVAERPELGLRPRLAVGIHLPSADARRPAAFAGTIWLQQGSAPLADDAEEILRGGAVLAARIMARLGVDAVDPCGAGGGTARACAATTSTSPRSRASWASPSTAGWRSSASRGPRRPVVPTGVIALSASAFRSDAQVGVDRRAGLRPAAQDRCPVIGDVVGAWSRGRSAPRTRLDPSRRRRGTTRRTGGRRGGPRRGGPRVRQRRSSPRCDRTGHVAGRGAHHGAAGRDRLAGRPAAQTGRPPGAAIARPGSDAGRHAAGLSGQFRRRRRGRQAAARAPEHRALPGPSHREAAVHVAGRSRRASGACAGIAGHANRSRRPACQPIDGHEVQPSRRRANTGFRRTIAS